MFWKTKKFQEGIRFLFPFGPKHQDTPIQDKLRAIGFLVGIPAGLITIVGGILWLLRIISFSWFSISSITYLFCWFHAILALSFILSRIQYHINIDKLISNENSVPSNGTNLKGDKSTTQEVNSEENNVDIHTLFLLIKSRDQLKLFAKNTLHSLKFFSNYWNYTCWIWFVYYAFFIASYHIEQDSLGIIMNINTQHLLSDIGFLVLNVASSLCIFVLYIIITYPTTRVTDNKLEFYLPSKALIFAVSVGLLTILGSIVLLDQIGHIHSASAACVNIVAGALSCIIFSLFIGRLDNKLLKIEPAFISILFIYSAIQFIYPIIDWTLSKEYFNEVVKEEVLKNIRMCLIIFAFFSKILLFKILLWGKRNHRLFVFLTTLNSLHTNYEEKRAMLYDKLNEERL